MTTKRKTKAKLYQVEIGYAVVGVGTLTQCQRAQAAIAGLTHVKLEPPPPGSKGERYVYVERDELPEVTKMDRPLMDSEAYDRECTLKLTHTESVKGGVV